MIQELTMFAKALGELAPQLSMILIMVGLYVFLIKREERQQQRYDEKDKAYLATLAALSADVKANWAVTQEISRAVDDSAKALSTLKCLQKNT